jgi:hypothetical protein
MKVVVVNNIFIFIIDFSNMIGYTTKEIFIGFGTNFWGLYFCFASKLLFC